VKVVLSGCSGGGKSSLLAELSRRGYATVAEPGRRIVDDPDAQADLPWVDLPRFMARCTQMAMADYAAAGPGVTFFDRSFLDAATNYARHGDIPAHLATALCNLRYHQTAYLVPPWPEIYVQDQSRRHDFAAAQAEYDALKLWLPRWRYKTVDIPRRPIAERADWLLQQIGLDARPVR
jgi:predicted ATPase